MEQSYPQAPETKYSLNSLSGQEKRPMNHLREGRIGIVCCLCFLFLFFVVQMNDLENDFELNCILRHWAMKEEECKPILYCYDVV